MESKELAQALSASIAEELQQWASEIPNLTNAYDYENQFSQRIKKISQLLLQTSVESNMLSKERDKKKSKVSLDQ